MTLPQQQPDIVTRLEDLLKQDQLLTTIVAKEDIKQLLKLWATCTDFRDKQSIRCAETIHQTDRVIENAYEFIEQVCDVIGYVKEEDDEDHFAS